MFKPVSPKVDFPELEKKLLAHWYQDGIVDAYLRRNDSATKRFSFLDGPITANNPMGVHHGWGRTYKDLWQRFWNMRGYKQRFQNGFDCQGLWVEVEVEKELGIRNKKEIENLVAGDKKASIAKFIQLCKERVLKFSSIQTEQSKRLGYFMDWGHSYYTMSDENNYMIWYFLKQCFENGWIYKGKDSVPWCPRCETAISQHEMLTEDYKELTHESIFIKFPIKTNGWENTFLLAWTTTPWTVPANVAVAIHPDFTYTIWENRKNGEKIIFISKDAQGNMPMRLLKKKEVPIQKFIFASLDQERYMFDQLKEVTGRELLGLHYETPFDDLPLVKKAAEERPKEFHKVVDGSEITLATEGTGILHEAPGNGKEDFELGKKYHLPIISHIDDTATYIEGMGEFAGKNAKKHPELIIDYMKAYENGKFLLKTMHYTHRYPACWRCKTELVWKVADEWYIAMDTPSKSKSKKSSSAKASLDKQKSKLPNSTLRQRMMDVAKMIKWIPGFGLERELDWLSNMHDWLISKKNRYWGLALPIYECQKCGTFEVIGSKEELQQRSVSGWEKFAGHSPHKPFIDEVKIACTACGGSISRIDDVGNVWLDAGIVPFSTYLDPKTGKLSYITDKKYWQEWFPVNFITESFPGQFKNWFYSMIAMSTVLERKNPFQTILGFASVLAEDGRPMHKSWGNAIEFNEGADKIGVDVMRWMYVTADPEQNLLFGYKHADETRRKFHLMLWNIYNFFITYANVDGWGPEEVQNSKFIVQSILDKWIISRLHGTIKIVTKSLEQYDAQKAALSIESFVNDLSLWYVRRSRDRVGPTAVDGEDKSACYQTLYLVLLTLSKLLAPFTPFLADDLFTNLSGAKSVHLADFPVYHDSLIDQSLEQQMIQVRKIVELALARRKENKIKIKQPLSLLTVFPSDETIKFKENLDYLLKEELNVKRIEYKHGKGELAIDLETEVTPALLAEGQAREIVRMIQEERKKLSTRLDERVDVSLERWPTGFESYIKQQALVGSLTQGTFAVKKIT